MLKKTFDMQFWKSGRRTLAEQFVGLGIILFASMGFATADGYLLNLGKNWFVSCKAAPWALPFSWYLPMSAIFHVLIGLSFWSVWRIESIRKLKLELTLFLTLFVLETLCCATLFALQIPLLSLIGIILWMCGTLLLTALFWKKEKSSGILMAISLPWIIYLMSTNMMQCIGNP